MPAHGRAVVATEHGGPEVLAVRDMVVPVPEPGDVVVQVRAAGVNPIDWKLYSGTFHAVDLKHRQSTGVDAGQFPMPVGMECAGVVTAVGVDVDDVAIGDEVIVHPARGAYATHVTVPVSAVTPKPGRLGWAAAGSLMLAGTTAAHSLHVTAVRHGQTVLIHGAAGGVGLMAVQLAVAAGDRVIGTASPANHALLTRLGAIPVSYGPGLLDRIQRHAPTGVDVALDFAGTDEALDTSTALIADPYRIASITGTPRRTQAGIRLLGYGPGQDAGIAVRAAARTDLVRRAGAGELVVHLADAFALTDAARAHQRGVAGHAAGKLVLIPSLRDDHKNDDQKDHPDGTR